VLYRHGDLCVTQMSDCVTHVSCEPSRPLCPDHPAKQIFGHFFIYPCGSLVFCISLFNRSWGKALLLGRSLASIPLLPPGLDIFCLSSGERGIAILWILVFILFTLFA